MQEDIDQCDLTLCIGVPQKSFKNIFEIGVCGLRSLLSFIALMSSNTKPQYKQLWYTMTQARISRAPRPLLGVSCTESAHEVVILRRLRPALVLTAVTTPPNRQTPPTRSMVLHDLISFKSPIRQLLLHFTR